MSAAVLYTALHSGQACPMPLQTQASEVNRGLLVALLPA